MAVRIAEVAGSLNPRRGDCSPENALAEAAVKEAGFASIALKDASCEVHRFLFGNAAAVGGSRLEGDDDRADAYETATSPSGVRAGCGTRSSWELLSPALAMSPAPAAAPGGPAPSPRQSRRLDDAAGDGRNRPGALLG